MRQQEAAREAAAADDVGAQARREQVRKVPRGTLWVQQGGVLTVGCDAVPAQINGAQASAQAAQAAAAAASGREAAIRAGIQKVLDARSEAGSAPAVALSLLHAAGGQMSLDELKASVSVRVCVPRAYRMRVACG